MQEKQRLSDLRQIWADVWGIAPHKNIGRTMLIKSIAFKKQYHLTQNQEAQLNTLIKQYKRNPRCFDEECTVLKPGTRLIRNWKGTRHAVTVKASGFDYQGQHYTSLSKIANAITSTRWNGRAFFGLKKKENT